MEDDDDDDDNKFLQRKSYVTERRDRVGKSGGGIFCYAHESEHYRRRVDLEDDIIEIMWLEIIYTSAKNVLIGFVYRPPNSKTNWLDLFIR